MKEHDRTHTGDKTVYLKKHDNIHTGDKTVHLKKHDSIHTGDKRVQDERLRRQLRTTGNGNGTSK